MPVFCVLLIVAVWLLPVISVVVSVFLMAPLDVGSSLPPPLPLPPHAARERVNAIAVYFISISYRLVLRVGF